MSADYAILSSIYDTVGMADFAAQMTPRLLQYAQQNDWLGSRILDLGCGTGAIAKWFHQNQPRYTVFGVDQSPEMMNHARGVLASHQLMQMDIRALKLQQTFDMVFCIDVLNELDSVRELEAVFTNVHQVLTANRLFMFDLHTIEGCAQDGLAGDTIIYNDEDLVVFRQTTYDFERQVYHASYEIFQKVDGAWQRNKAERIQRAYPIQAVATLLRRQNFEVVSVLTPNLREYEMGAANTPRVIFVAKRL